MSRNFINATLLCVFLFISACHKYEHLSYSEDLPSNVKQAMEKTSVTQLHTKMGPTQIMEHFAASPQIMELLFVDQDGELCHLLAYTIAFRVSISFSFRSGKMEQVQVFYEGFGQDSSEVLLKFA